MPFNFCMQKNTVFNLLKRFKAKPGLGDPNPTTTFSSNFKTWYNRSKNPSPNFLKIRQAHLVQNLIEPSLIKKGLSYDIKTYRTDNGINTWRFTNKTNIQNNKDKKKLIETPLLLVHGYLTSSMHYYKNIPYLLENHKTVYMIDLPGHGATKYYSDLVYPETEPFRALDFKIYNKGKNFKLEHQLDNRSYKAMFGEIRDTFFNEMVNDWMKQQHLKKINLVGHSYGGYFSFHYWLKNPDAVNKLILLSPLGVEKNIWSVNNIVLSKQEYDIDKDPLSWTYLPDRKAPKFFLKHQWKLFMAMGPFGVKLLRNFFERRFRNDDKLFQKYCFENAYLQSDTNLELSTILFNTFFTNYMTSYDPILDYGDALETRKNDIKILYGQYDWMDKRCASEFKNHAIIPNAGHNLNLDNPEDTGKEIVSFLKN